VARKNSLNQRREFGLHSALGMKPRPLHNPILIAALLICIFGCSAKSKAPKPTDAEAALRARITQESAGRFGLTRFEKIQDMGTAGGDIRWAFQAEVECVEDGIWLFDDSSGTIPIDFRTTNGVNGIAGRPIRKGQSFQIVGNLQMGKAKQGWQVTHVGMNRYPVEIRSVEIR
jgi:hypothetical protein